MEKPVLYTYFRSSCSWRVRIALAHKGIEYESKFVNLLKLDQVSPEQLSLNPMGQIPVLAISGHVLAQSIPIMEFLEEVYSANPLLPEDKFARAKVREICEIIGSGIQPIQNRATMLAVSDVESKRAEWANCWITKGFEALEKVVAQTSGVYCFGDQITLADCCLVPQVYNALRFNVDMTKFPTISRLNATLEKLEAFKEAHALVQPDCPDELRK